MSKGDIRAVTWLMAVAGVLGLGTLLAVAHGAPMRAGSTGGTELRQVWGDPNLMGVWEAAKLDTQSGQDQSELAKLEALYRPNARKSVSPQDDPGLHCSPSAFPRAATYGWPIQIVQSPGWIYIYSEAFATYRIIPTNGRHLSPDYLTPYYLGDSAGRWEGDKLIVDVISFNGQSWLAGSEDKPTKTSLGVWPTSDALHVVEQWRRVDENTLEYQARVEDPKMLTGAWETPKIKFKKQSSNKIYEVKCLLGDPEPGARVPDPALYLKQFGR